MKLSARGPTALLLTLLAASLAAQAHGLEQTQDQPEQAVLQGTVVNAQNGRAVPRAFVKARNVKAADTVTVRADGEGHFIFPSLAPGTYAVSAERQGFFSYGHKRSFQPVVELSAGDSPKNLLVRLLPSSVITGHVVDENGDPLQNIQVRVFTREYRMGRLRLAPAGSAATDDRGEYRISGLRPGNYYVLAEQAQDKLFDISGPLVAVEEVGPLVHHSVENALADAENVQKNQIRIDPGRPAISAAGFAYPPLFYPATSDFLEAQALPVAPGDELHASFVFFTMPSVTIKGVVSNGLTGEHAKNATAAAYWTEYLGEDAAQTAEISKDGTFAIRGLAPGTYTLRASFGQDNASFSDQRTVEVGPQGLDNVLMAGVPDSQVDGRVTVQGDALNPLKSAAFTFLPADREGNLAVTARGPSLAFQGTLHPGERYTVTAASLPGDYYLKSVRIDGHEVERNNVMVGGTHEQIELALNPDGGHIEGTVFDEKGQPVAAQVMAVPDEKARVFPDLFRKGHSDNKGHFTLRGVPPGTYKVIAFSGPEPDELINHPDLLKDYEDHSETVIVSEGGQYQVALRRTMVE